MKDVIKFSTEEDTSHENKLCLLMILAAIYPEKFEGEKGLNLMKDMPHENKLRLLMILAAIYPEKFEGEKGLDLMKVARLTRDDMNAVNNLRMLGGQPDATKSSTGAFSLKFDIRKSAARKDCSGEAETWQLSRFYPIIEELIEKLSKNELSKEDYPCLNDPSSTFHGTPFAGFVNQNPPAHSKRSRRTPTWARLRGSDDGYSSDSVLRRTSSDFKKMGQRIFVFIVGGATRFEKLKMLTTQEISLDDLQI